MRLIDCNEALRKIEQIPFIANESKAFHEGCRYMQKKVLRIFHESKSVDAEPVRHGHWIKNDIFSDDWNTTSNCSVCGGCVSWFSVPLNYCPDCGAKMDEKEI